MKESRFFFDLEKDPTDTHIIAIRPEIIKAFEKRLYEKTKKGNEENERWKQNSLEQSFSKVIR